MDIIPIKALSDNYIWALKEEDTLIIVDPGESEKLMQFIDESDLQLTTILLTHKHEDHVGGVLDLVGRYPGTEVYGPEETERINTKTISDNNTFELNGHKFNVILTNGHTEEHISYLMDNKALFSGDALFSGGCGRVFTEDYEAQFNSLQKFKDINDNVEIYGGHEYTVANLEFGESVEPNNQAIIEALARAKEIREDDRSTYPSTIENEKEINVFLKASNVEAFKDLRQAKDNQ